MVSTQQITDPQGWGSKPRNGSLIFLTVVLWSTHRISIFVGILVFLNLQVGQARVLHFTVLEGLPGTNTQDYLPYRWTTKKKCCECNTSFFVTYKWVKLECCITLDWHGLPGTNPLGYWVHMKVTKENVLKWIQSRVFISYVIYPLLSHDILSADLWSLL